MIYTERRTRADISILFALLCLMTVITVLSNGESSSSYISVRTLDYFGNAVQLAHAKEAAQRFGRSVVVAVVQVHEQENEIEKIPTIRLEEKNDQHHPTLIDGKLPLSSFVIVVSLGKSPILHPIRLPSETKDINSSSLLAMCFTGVKGDANWLLHKVQKHAADMWERYNTFVLSPPFAAHAVARLLGRFTAQPEHQEWQCSLGLPGKQNSDNDRQSFWSRPLGVQTMILSLSSYSPTSTLSAVYNHRLRDPGLLIIEPSGRVLNPIARSDSGEVSLGAMGKGCKKIQARLLRLLQGNMKGKMNCSSSSWGNLPPTYDRCQDMLIRILLEETANVNCERISRGDNTGGDIIVESYSTGQDKIKRRIFRYQNASSFAPV